jgi:vancomycin resistance protein VanJ
MRWLRRLIVPLAYAYPAVLLALCLAFVRIGEKWWLTAGLLYLPRVFFAAPLVVLAPALWFMRERKLLWTQAVGLTLTVFPLMGLVLPWPSGTPAGASFQLLSFNVNNGYGGSARLLSAIDQAKADLVLLQEAPQFGGPLIDGLRARFPHVETSTQFTIASRFPILERTDPDKIPNSGRSRSPRFMRYVVGTSVGKLAVYSVHPISPRGTFGVYRTRALLHRLRTGELFSGDPESDLGQNAALRARQIAAAAALAAKEKYPVLIAGDTNLPGLSAALHQSLSAYTDAFAQASSGFGYTFPAAHPFLRLDRVLVGPQLRFSEFRLGCPDTSDHLCVMARVIPR